MDIDLIKGLYNSGKSVPQIANELGLSQWMLYNKMKREKVLRRLPAESNKIRFLSKPLSFSKKNYLRPMERDLMIAGLMLYWAEGSKRNINTIDFANSDPKMVVIFLNLFRSIYQIQEDKLRVLLYCYANQSIPDLILFWKKLTKIPEKQFTKPYVRSDFQEDKVNRMRYGMVHIRYNDQRLMTQLKKDIDSFTKQLV
ncbi:MAG: hypothetical protein AAB647_01935 [Patescibacteria group bacterium]